MADISKLQAAFNAAVKGAIGEDRKHGWGVEDSAEVIESLIAEELPTGTVPSDELMRLIRMVINPSAFRQLLERTKRPDGQTVLEKDDSKKREKAFLSLYS